MCIVLNALNAIIKNKTHTFLLPPTQWWWVMHYQSSKNQKMSMWKGVLLVIDINMCTFCLSLDFSRLRSVTCRWGGHLETSYLVTLSAAPWPPSWPKPPHSWFASCIALTTGPIASTRPWSNGSTRLNPALESQPVCIWKLTEMNSLNVLGVLMP